MPVKAQIRAVVLSAQFGSADVLQSDQSAVRADLQNYVVELCGIGEASDCANANLVSLRILGWRLSDLSRGHLNVLFAQRGDHVRGGDASAREAGGVKPNAHGVDALAEVHDVGDAFHALEGIANVEIDVVAQEKAGVFPVFAINAGAKDEARRALSDSDAGGFHFVGHSAESGIDAVLNVDSSKINVARDVEGDVDLAAAIVAAGGGHVLHAFHTIDLLLERSGDGRFHGLGASAGVIGGNTDLRRREVRELRDGQSRNGNRPCENNQQGADCGKDRAVNEEIYKHFVGSFDISLLTAAIAGSNLAPVMQIRTRA